MRARWLSGQSPGQRRSRIASRVVMPGSTNSALRARESRDMTAFPWTPWHKVVKLREDVRTGELSLSIFAADLYDVVMGKARPVYQDPRAFFALTYPTVALRDLARDVALRLARRNDKAVRQLELTYGGGQTHTPL